MTCDIAIQNCSFANVAKLQLMRAFLAPDEDKRCWYCNVSRIYALSHYDFQNFIGDILSLLLSPNITT